MRRLVDQKKIVLMSKLAVYDKRYKRKDQRILNYFIEDYIYLNNMKARVGITLIVLCHMIAGGFKIMMEGIIIPESITDFIACYVAPYILPWFVLTVLYTLISTYVSGRKYRRVEKRFNAYKKMVNALANSEGHQTENEGAVNENE